MAVHEDLSVVYHQQDTDYYCGAACAQMVLSEIGAGLLNQDDLYTDNHNHSTAESGWYSGPDGVTWTLNNRRPASFNNYFVLFALANEDSISRKIVWTIHHYKVAPIAMVYGSAHWIVIRGYNASAAPASAADTSYTIDAFEVNNPWPPVPSPAPPPPHSSSDGCGSGGTRGVADQHITYSTWQTDYMTGVPGGYWGGKFLAVCDPEPPPDRPGKQRRPDERLSGDRIITPEQAARFAVAGLEKYGLFQKLLWKDVLLKAKPGMPYLVQRLDHPDRYYYVVPMQQSEKKVPVLASVDARFGDYRQAVAVPERHSALLPNLDPKAMLKKIVGRRFELEDRLGRLLVRKEALCVYPTLVWKPCRESLSPFWPFHLVTVGNYQLYIRIDGMVFTKLHDAERGI